MIETDEIIFFERAISFIREIGIETAYAVIDDGECFLPGLLIAKGKIIIDKNKMKFPGDILHEAAHIAIVPSAERKDLDGKNIGTKEGRRCRRNDGDCVDLRRMCSPGNRSTLCFS